jgi:2-isopropylmalate synthase
MNHTAFFDWDRTEGAEQAPPAVEVHDETLRDGLQSPSVHDPPVADKQRFVRLLDQLGVGSVCLGFPAAGARAARDVEILLRTIDEEGLRIAPVVAGRTHEGDIRPILDICQRVGRPVEAMLFVGSSPVRMAVERWSEAHLLQVVKRSVALATGGGLAVGFVTEDTVRSHPGTLRDLFSVAVDGGVARLALCDTVGCVTAAGTGRIVRWTHDLLVELGVRERVAIDWHGHDDRGLALSNALVAAAAGADRLHGTVLGVGERVGNTPLDLLLVNLKLQGSVTGDLGRLAELVELTSASLHVPIPFDYPVFGRDAFRTATGVHAAAIVKAAQDGRADWIDRVYSGVPAGWFGRAQVIEIGPMSGRSNVRHWLERHGLEAGEARIARILEAAKRADAVLDDAAVRALLDP